LNNYKWHRRLAVVSMIVAASACQAPDDDSNEQLGVQSRGRDSGSIQDTLGALPSADVADVDEDGIPSFIFGEVGRVTIADAVEDTDLTEILAAVSPVFRADPAALVLRRSYTDNIGDSHFRFRQTKNGLDVLGGELVVHVRDGVVYAVNGGARDDLQVRTEPKLDGPSAVQAALASSSSVEQLDTNNHALLAYKLQGNQLVLVYQVDVTGIDYEGTPVWDTVLVNAVDGTIVDRMPHIHTAKNREMHNLNHGTSLPGPLSRTEGQAAVADSDVNTNYDRLGATYDCYSALFGRDSYNGAGAKLISSVHYSNNYVNAYWNNTQMVYGDGDGTTATSLARSMDVTAHELTHAVTSTESNLTYSGESGGLNEAMSDIFGNVCEWYADGQVVSANTWMVGEDIWTPPVFDDDALRYMHDPVLDGGSLDFWTPSAGNVDVHYSSGIANLAFKLLSTGGTHPRGKSPVNVTGIGIEKAAQIFYRANRDLLTPSSNFAAAKTATEQAAIQLGYTAAEQASVTAAWNAVGVGVPVPPPVTTPLTNGVPVGGLSASTGAQLNYSLVVPAGQTTLTFQISGGSGDADLYVKSGSAPTLASYTCRPYLGGNAETCTFNSPVAATWYVMLNAYSSFSGVTLTGTYAGSPPPAGNTLTNGVPVNGISGATGNQKFWTMEVPAGKATLSFQTSGGTGDADLYVRFGSAPTTTTYNCRPYLNGNNETCTFPNPQAGTWHVMMRGYSAYSGAQLVGTHP
jgi:vibriolysin